MDAVCSESSASTNRAGFAIRLGEPASLKGQASARLQVPPSLRLRGAVIPRPGFAATDGFHSSIHSLGEIAPLLKPVVTLAHKNGWGATELTNLVAAQTLAERLSRFEDLAHVVCQELSERAERAGEVCACELREILKNVGGEALATEFDNNYATCRQILDFSFGLVNDRNGNEFGQASEQFRFRLFSDLEFMVFPSSVSSDYLAAFQNLMFSQLPLVGFIPSNAFFEYTLDWMTECYNLELPETLEASQIDEFIGVLEQAESELSKIDSAPSIESEAPDFFDKLVLLVGGKAEATAVLMKVKDASDELGGDGYSAMWSCFDYCHQKAGWTEIAQSVKEITAEGGLAAVFGRLSEVDDNTSLSAFLLGAQTIIEREMATNRVAKEVFDYQDESDISIDFKIPFETKVLSRRELADDAYNTHNEFAMNGDLCTSSVCVHINDDTLMAMESWQRSIAIMAAVYVAGNNMKEETGHASGQK